MVLESLRTCLSPQNLGFPEAGEFYPNDLGLSSQTLSQKRGKKMLGTLRGLQCQRGKCCRSDRYCTEIHSDQWRIYVYRHSDTRLGTWSNTNTNILYPRKLRLSLTCSRHVPVGKCLVNPSDHVDGWLRWKGSLGAAAELRSTPARFSSKLQIATQLAHRLH